MARLQVTNITQTSATLAVTELSTSATYTSVFIDCDGKQSPNLAYTTSQVATSRTWTVTGLSSGTTYTAVWMIQSQAGSSDIGSGTFTTQSAPITIGGVGTVELYNSGRGSVMAFWSTATNAVDYRIEVYDLFGTLVRETSTSSTNIVISGLSTGTFYEFKVYGRRSGSTNGTSSYATITTTSYVVGNISNLTASSSSTSVSVTLSWSSATNAQVYYIDIYSGSSLILSTSTTSTTRTFTAPNISENTAYTARVYGGADGYTNGNYSSVTFTTMSYAPQALPSLNLSASTGVRGVIYVSWGSATNATGYRWEVYRGNNTNSSNLVDNGSTTSTSVTVTNLSEYTLYTVKVYGTRSGYASGGARTETVTTADLTPPVINSLTGDSDGKMYISFSASDAHSGLRTTSTYYTEISNKNGTTYGNGAYSTNAYRTFISDSNGNEFEHGAYYYMRVTVYDNYNNTATSTQQFQYRRTRPNNWAWSFTISQGVPVQSLTASEWNSFCLRINQFRQYKRYDNYSFTTVSSGSVMTASVMNQARNAIATMTPPTSVPSVVVAGVTPITASYFNTLRASLNSIL